MDILAPLYAWPSVQVYGLFITGAAVLAAAACVLLAPLVRPPSTKDHLDLAMRTTGAVMAGLTLILAFCAVQARSQSSDAQRLVTAEVSAIGGLIRLIDRLGPAGLPARGELAGYLHSIATEEFGAMAEAGRAAPTQARAEALEHAIYAAAAEAAGHLATDLLEEMDAVDAAREARLHGASIRLPAEFWLLIQLLVLLLLATSPLYPPRRHTVAMLAVQMGGVGALIAFVFLMDQPFRGHLTISAQPYATLLAQRGAFLAADRMPAR